MRKESPKLLIADTKGKIYDVPWLQASGMKGGECFRLNRADLVELHPDSEFFLLPSRVPAGYDTELGRYVSLEHNPLVNKDEPCFPVAVFMAPGLTTTFNPAYTERAGADPLPLFSYAAVALYKDRFYAAGYRVDREKRQELEGMDVRRVRENIKAFRKIFPGNRLVRHLETCALSYCCPAAKNFFLKRYECPLPASTHCNARCIGCISYQPGGKVPVTQPRITFTPTAEEIAEAAVFHIREVRDPVVSFGQGCEGEPLMAGDVLEKAVKLIRQRTRGGIINLNTNASRPDVVKRLFDSGLDSMRVSMNSVRKPFYDAYYMPRGYTFGDVLRSIKNAKAAGGFVSINYLVMPGFTDSTAEAGALKHFLDRTNADMIQWRNLNYDPLAYFGKMKTAVKPEDMIGVDTLIRQIRSQYPRLMHGYFNPSKARIRRAGRKRAT
ncbi:MAG: radical SAM protein [Candidatus Omnitrophota bacterium]